MGHWEGSGLSKVQTYVFKSLWDFLLGWRKDLKGGKEIRLSKERWDLRACWTLPAEDAVLSNDRSPTGKLLTILIIPSFLKHFFLSINSRSYTLCFASYHIVHSFLFSSAPSSSSSLSTGFRPSNSSPSTLFYLSGNLTQHHSFKCHLYVDNSQLYIPWSNLSLSPRFLQTNHLIDFST